MGLGSGGDPAPSMGGLGAPGGDRAEAESAGVRLLAVRASPSGDPVPESLVGVSWYVLTPRSEDSLLGLVPPPPGMEAPPDWLASELAIALDRVGALDPGPLLFRTAPPLCYHQNTMLFEHK